MIEGIEHLYEQIAEAIHQAIPEDWDTAKVEAVFFPDSSDYLGEYTRSVDGAARSFAMGMSGGRVFRQLRKLFQEAGQPLWGQACFELHSDGKFNMKWGYDNCDENGDTIWNKDEWHRRQEERRQRLISD